MVNFLHSVYLSLSPLLLNSIILLLMSFPILYSHIMKEQGFVGVCGQLCYG